MRLRLLLVPLCAGAALLLGGGDAAGPAPARPAPDPDGARQAAHRAEAASPPPKTGAIGSTPYGNISRETEHVLVQLGGSAASPDVFTRRKRVQVSNPAALVGDAQKYKHVNTEDHHEDVTPTQDTTKEILPKDVNEKDAIQTEMERGMEHPNVSRANSTTPQHLDQTNHNVSALDWQSPPPHPKQENLESDAQATAPPSRRPSPSGAHRASAQISRYDDEDVFGAGGAGEAGDAGGAGRDRPRGRAPPEGAAPAPPPAPPLHFPESPAGEGFRVNDLGLSDGVFMFKYLGSFLSWMQPYDFPVELLRDALWKRVSVPSLIAQSLPVEAGFLACVGVGVALALAAPLYVLGHACCLLCRRAPPPPPPPPPPPAGAWDDDYAAPGSGCRRRALLFVLDVLLLLMVAGVVAMFVSNEQVSGAVARSPAVLHTALADASAFLRNTNLQLHFVLTKSLDRAVEAASADLDNVENLLGRPIQRQLEEETGVGVALDALVDVTAGAQAAAALVAALLERAGEARGLALVAQERLADLRLQVDALRRQCPPKDRALCDTVEAAGLGVTLELDALLSDARLAVLRRLAEGNLSAAAQQARGEFQFIPTHVEQQTRDARSGVRRQLLRQRGLLDDAVWALDALSRDLGARVEEARERSLRVAEAAADLEYWRYVAAVGAAAAVLLLWALLLGALSCGCCGAEDKARPTLFTWAALLCPLYLALWGGALLALLVGGHGEVFVCRPLFDEPRFDALTALVDRPGVLFQRRGGFFSNLLYANDSLDVPLRDVLRACEQNRPSYPAFRLHQVLDVDAATDHRRWEQLHRQLNRLEVNLTQLQLLTPGLQVQLSGLLNAALVNLTSHRSQLSSPVTGKDLTSFADQLESVANQITDLATASRMETLASRTRRLLASHLEPLKLRKEDLVYQITSLEVQLVPLQRQVNQSLSHLKTIQFFINNQGANISHTKSREYAGRLVSYVQQYREHVLRATGESVAPCRPIWDLFHAVRQLLCRHIMDPLNGFWFGAVWCLLLLLAAAPLSVKLAESYPRSQPPGLLHRASAESPPDPPILPEQTTWSTPGAPEPGGW
ncbi:hypothetical protein R5R35_000383 [Gryllus longicercus]|uniref:Uncharacterized protein n=1 Tax=Gryllus longicercus TaxID=2509291 RepID=A0AAN9VNA7_9ORTH